MGSAIQTYEYHNINKQGPFKIQSLMPNRHVLRLLLNYTLATCVSLASWSLVELEK